MTEGSWLAEADLSVASAQGLDVSNFQGKFDWAGTSGLSFGVFRLTQGLGGAGLNSPDPAAAWNHAQIAARGLARGAYHFLDPGEDGAAQARYFSAQYTALGMTPADGLWLDNETSNGHSPATVAACARAFMAELKALHPHQPAGVYTFVDFAGTGYCDGLGQYPLWLAWPNAAAPKPPPPWANWRLWQWGIRNGTDRDAFNGTPADLHSWLASFARPGPPARTVSSGKQSLHAFAASRGWKAWQVLGLTAAQEHGFPAVSQPYVDAGDWLAPMPAGMPVWSEPPAAGSEEPSP